MKVATVVGARPQFIKAAAVSPAMRRQGIVETLVHTGQHYDPEMSGVFFSELNLPVPDVQLGIGSGSHAQQTGAMMPALERAFLESRPDCVLVYGDTNSTLAGALTAAKLQIPVVHIEAGLRSFNRRMPEEINRVLTDAVSDLLFTPTETGRCNLEREGVPPVRISIVGDVMYDCTKIFAAKAATYSRILERVGVTANEYVLATVHRAENTDNPARLRNIVDALSMVARTRTVIWPIHPRTRKMLAEHAITLNGADGLRTIEPVGYLDMARLEQNALVIVTDSGGVQKEAFFFGVPCVTVRDETEWVELVEHGWNCVCPPLCSSRLAEEIESAVGRQGRDSAVFGDGRAADRIAVELTKRFMTGARH